MAPATEADAATDAAAEIPSFTSYFTLPVQSTTSAKVLHLAVVWIVVVVGVVVAVAA